jgi:hypothetical protein
MNWNLEGSVIVAKYLGEVSIKGLVVESRVKYGGKVQHTVDLETPVILKWRTEPVTRVLIGDEEILFVFDKPGAKAA